MGLEAKPGLHRNLYKILKERNIDVFQTLGVHDVICRLPSFTDLKEFRRIVDSILFTTQNGAPIVENTSSYLILERTGPKSPNKPTAFFFLRSGKLQSREQFDKTVTDVYNINGVLAVSTAVGQFDLICEIESSNLAELKSIVNTIVSTPGVSARATMVCMVVGSGATESTN